MQISHGKLILFADDTSIILKGKNTLTLMEQINNTTQQMTEWFENNKLVLNAAK